MFKVHVFYTRWAELGKTMLEADYGPFATRESAEECLIVVASREDVYGAEVRPVSNGE